MPRSPGGTGYSNLPQKPGRSANMMRSPGGIRYSNLARKAWQERKYAAMSRRDKILVTRHAVPGRNAHIPRSPVGAKQINPITNQLI